MSLEAEIHRVVLASAPELAAALLAHIERPRMLPIKEAPISYRLILAAERAGELPVYRVGHSSFIAEGELFEFIRRTCHQRRDRGPVPPRSPETRAPPGGASEERRAALRRPDHGCSGARRRALERG